MCIIIFHLFQTKADRNHIGQLEYFPPEGFPMSFFPYSKKPNFRPPLMMLKFLNPTPDVLITIQCHLLAANTDEVEEDIFGTEFQLRVLESFNLTTKATEVQKASQNDDTHTYGPTKQTDLDTNATQVRAGLL